MRTPDRTTTWADLARRTDAFGAALVEAGIVAPPVAAAAPTEPWRCPNPRVALYMHNHPAYLEAMVGAWKARATGMNVNYRYRATELVDLLNDAEPEAVVYHQAFTPTLSEAVSYTHLRAHETVLDLVCRLLLEKKKTNNNTKKKKKQNKHTNT